MFERSALQDLQDWYQGKWGAVRKPLVIRGARQVGKSTLVRSFAKKQGLHLVEADLEKQPHLKVAFATKNVDTILQALEDAPHAPRLQPNSLIFLDEIQAFPKAFESLRYFYEDRPDLAVVTAGSLLEHMFYRHRVSVPVGRIQYLYMGPLSFSEFLIAVGEKNLASRVQDFQVGDTIDEYAHIRLLEQLKIYFRVGGMPEAIDKYIKTKSFSQVSTVLHTMEQTYRDDFPKYTAAQSTARVYNVFSQMARHVGRQIKVSSLFPDHKVATIKNDIDLLCTSCILIKVIHSHCNGFPLQGEIDGRVFKVFLLDVGLWNAMSGLFWSADMLKNDVPLVHQGAMAEQFVAQHLLHISFQHVHPQLVFWRRGGKGGAAEVDFVVQREGRIVPVEVKSGASGSLKSLHQFMALKKLDTAFRFDTNRPSTQKIETKAFVGTKTVPVHYTLHNLPLYLIEKTF